MVWLRAPYQPRIFWNQGLKPDVFCDRYVRRLQKRYVPDPVIAAGLREGKKAARGADVDLLAGED